MGLENFIAKEAAKPIANFVNSFEAIDYKASHPVVKGLDRYQSDIFYYMYDWLNVCDISVKYNIYRPDVEEMLKNYIAHDQEHRSTVMNMAGEVLMPHELDKLMCEFDYAYDEAERNMYEG